MTNSNVSKSSTVPNSSSYVLTCGDVDYQSDYSSQKDSSFIDPSTYLFSNEYFFDPSFEGFNSPPILPEHSENPVTIAYAPAPPVSSSDTHIVPACKDCYQCSPMSSSLCGANTPDHSTPSLSISNPDPSHGRATYNCPCNVDATFVSPSQCQSFPQGTPPPPRFHQGHQFDAASSQSACPHFTISSAIHPYNSQSTDFNKSRSSSCPNSPAPKHKQASGKSVDTELINTEHEPGSEKNHNFLQPKCPQHSDSSLSQELGCTGEEELGSVFSQNCGTYSDDESLCSTQRSSTQASSFSEETHSFAEISSQQEGWSPSGNDKYNFSAVLEKLPFEKGKDSKKRKNINERERNRVRIMNMAFKELGDVCAIFTNERPSTKLATIQQALSVLNKIDSLKPGETLSRPMDKI